MSRMFDIVQRRLGRGADLPTVYLVACVAKKGAHPMPAEDLYQSTWFKKARAHVEAQGEPWLILSAKHGVVEPGQRIGPYEQTLNRMPAAQRNQWGARALRQLQRRFPRPTRFVVLAGRRYRDPIVPVLRELGHQVEVPMEGLGIGEQLSWLTKRGSRSFDVATIDPYTRLPDVSQYSVRVMRFPDEDATFAITHPRQHRVERIALVPDYDYDRVIVCHEGGTHADLMALDVRAIEAGGMERWGDASVLHDIHPHEHRLHGSVRVELAIPLRESITSIPEPLRRFSAVWFRTRAFRGISVSPGSAGYAPHDWGAQSWTSRMEYSTADWGDEGGCGEAYTVVFEPEVRRKLGGRKKLLPWPSWTAPLYAALAHRGDLWVGASITHNPFRAELDAVERQIQAIVAGVFGEPVEAIFEAR